MSIVRTLLFIWLSFLNRGNVQCLRRITIENFETENIIELQPEVHFKPVLFNNNYELPITVYWIDMESDPLKAVKMNEVLPGKYLNASSRNGHVFCAVVNENSKESFEATPKLVKMSLCASTKVTFDFNRWRYCMTWKRMISARRLRLAALYTPQWRASTRWCTTCGSR